MLQSKFIKVVTISFTFIKYMNDSAVLHNCIEKLEAGHS